MALCPYHRSCRRRVEAVCEGMPEREYVFSKKILGDWPVKVTVIGSLSDSLVTVA